jgi:hypothetical protein
VSLDWKKFGSSLLNSLIEECSQYEWCCRNRVSCEEKIFGLEKEYNSMLEATKDGVRDHNEILTRQRELGRARSALLYAEDESMEVKKGLALKGLIGPPILEKLPSSQWKRKILRLI